MELIKVTSNGKGDQVCSARELYSFLDVETKFTTWCKRMFSYGLIEGVDFVPFLGESQGGRPQTDFILTLDTAKEISMVQRSDKGKLARQYFIECEKKLRSFVLPNTQTYLSEHSRRDVQVQNSKEVNAKIYFNMGVESVIEYNQKSCLLHSGKKPSELKEYAKQIGLRSKQRSSGKEVLRNLKPEIACCMSLTDEMVKRGKDLESAAKLNLTHAQPLFKEMLNLGMAPGELAA